MSTLKNLLIRIGSDTPSLRSHLRPVLDYITERQKMASSSEENLERIVNHLRDFQLKTTETSQTGNGVVGVLSHQKEPRGFEVKVEVYETGDVEAYYDSPTSRGGSMPSFLFRGHLHNFSPKGVAQVIDESFYKEVVLPTRERKRD